VARNGFPGHRFPSLRPWQRVIGSYKCDRDMTSASVVQARDIYSAREAV
jgi:hypothetical protein